MAVFDREARESFFRGTEVDRQPQPAAGHLGVWCGKEIEFAYRVARGQDQVTEPAWTTSELAITIDCANCGAFCACPKSDVI